MSPNDDDFDPSDENKDEEDVGLAGLGASPIRRHFGLKQIRSRLGLWPGRKVLSVDRSGLTLYTLTSWPFQENGSWWVRGKYQLGNRDWFEETLSLIDHNIYPNKYGLWNKTNHLKRRFLFWPF